MLSVVSIIIEEPDKNSGKVNDIISNYRNYIKGRMGIPFDDRNIGIITIILDCDINQVNALTGKIGKLKGVYARATFQNKAKNLNQGD